MFQPKHFFYSIILLSFLSGSFLLFAQQTDVVSDSTNAKVDSLTYSTDDVVVTATRVEKKIIDILIR